MILEEETFKKYGYYPDDLKPESHKKIIVICEKCKKIRITSKHHYHSLCKSCSHQKPKIRRICKQCGKEFKITPYRMKMGRGIFCSRNCQGKGQSKNRKGKNHPFFGKHHTKEIKDRIRKARKHRKFPKHHTKPERIFELICKKYNLPFKYTGNSSFWIGRLNPDFIEENGKKVVVEIFGDYWHSPLNNRNLREIHTLEYRKQYYKRRKWISIFFWESDLLRKDAEQFVLLKLSKYALLPSFQ